MELHELRARGVSPTLRGTITNPLRRLLWPLHAPYFAALLEVADNPRNAGTGGDPAPARREQAREAKVDAQRHYDALKKDLMAIAHRLASLEEQAAGHAPAASAAPDTSPPAVAQPPRASYALCGEDRIVDHLLRRCGAPAAIRYLDIGAGDPAIDSNTFLFHQQGGSGVLVEPDPGRLPAYRAARPRDCVESAALVPAADAQQHPSVTAATIDTMLDRHFADGVLHLVSIDSPGIDDATLRDIDFTRHRPWVLVVGAKVSGALAGILAGQGYAAYADTHVHRIFVREDVLARAAA